jgi:hypothetical protein
MNNEDQVISLSKLVISQKEELIRMCKLKISKLYLTKNEIAMKFSMERAIAWKRCHKSKQNTHSRLIMRVKNKLLRAELKICHEQQTIALAKTDVAKERLIIATTKLTHSDMCNNEELIIDGNADTKKNTSIFKDKTFVEMPYHI